MCLSSMPSLWALSHFITHYKFSPRYVSLLFDKRFKQEVTKSTSRYLIRGSTFMLQRLHNDTKLLFAFFLKLFVTQNIFFFFLTSIRKHRNVPWLLLHEPFTLEGNCMRYLLYQHNKEELLIFWLSNVDQNVSCISLKIIDVSRIRETNRYSVLLCY